MIQKITYIVIGGIIVAVLGGAMLLINPSTNAVVELILPERETPVGIDEGDILIGVYAVYVNADGTAIDDGRIYVETSLSSFTDPQEYNEMRLCAFKVLQQKEVIR